MRGGANLGVARVFPRTARQRVAKTRMRTRELCDEEICILKVLRRASIDWARKRFTCSRSCNSDAHHWVRQRSKGLVCLGGGREPDIQATGRTGRCEAISNRPWKASPEWDVGEDFCMQCRCGFCSWSHLWLFSEQRMCEVPGFDLTLFANPASRADTGEGR